MPEVALLADTTVERPLYSFLMPFPAVCFVGAFVTDLAYWRSTSFMWETFSVWLLAAGLVMAAITVVAGIVDLSMKRRFQIGAIRLICAFLVVVLSLVNVFIHSRDGYTAVVPTGLILSGVVALLLLFTAAIGRTVVYRASQFRLN
jgi:uncharacterized membrane protein